MIPNNETFDNTFPFTPHFSTAPGFRMHYVDEGKGRPVVLLHGEPTWGYLFRQIIPRLSQNYRVIVPDHMGFGKSETPQDRDYIVQAHVDNLEALLLELDLRDITLVMHDWGGPIGGGFALRHIERIDRLVVTNTLLPLGLPAEQELMARNAAESAWFQWMTKLHQSGTMETVLSEFGTIVLSLMKTLQGFERSDVITPAWIRAYNMPFASPEECVGAISFPRSIVDGSARFETGNAQAIADLRRKPAMMIVGMHDRAALPKYTIPLFEAGFPGAPIYQLYQAGHFLYEDEPDAIAALIEQFAQSS